MSETMTDGALRWCERQGTATQAEVRSMAAEVRSLREAIARLTGSPQATLRPDRCTTHHAACDCREAAIAEQLRLADALAEEIESIEDHVGKQTAGYVARYRAARSAR